MYVLVNFKLFKFLLFITAISNANLLQIRKKDTVRSFKSAQANKLFKPIEQSGYITKLHLFLPFCNTLCTCLCVIHRSLQVDKLEAKINIGCLIKETVKSQFLKSVVVYIGSNIFYFTLNYYYSYVHHKQSTLVEIYD